MTAKPEPKTIKRPAWVWAISIFTAFGFLWTLASIYLIRSGALPVSSEVQSFFSHMSWFEVLLLPFVNLCAAIFLFFLRKIAFYLFLVAFVLTAKEHVSLLFGYGTTMLAPQGASEIIGTFIGLAISAAICMYSWKLTKRNILR